MEAEQQAVRQPPRSGQAESRLDVRAYLSAFGHEIAKERHPGSGVVMYCLERCVFDPNHWPNEASIIQQANGTLSYQCFHESCKGRTWHDARRQISGEEKLGPWMFGGNGHRHQANIKPEVKPSSENSTPVENESRSAIIRAVLTTDQFTQIKVPDRNAYLKPFIKEGTIGMLTAPRGVGKTGFVSGILNAVSRHENFGPWECGVQVPVMLMDGEMSIHDNRERIVQLGLDCEREAPFYIYCDAYAYLLGIPRARLTDEAWREAMKEILEDLQVKLWAVDNIASLSPGLDENAKKDWDPINQWLIDLRFAGISTILLHHDNKMGGQRGTSAREDNLDYSIQLIRPNDYTPEDGARFIAHFTKQRVENSSLHLIGDTEFHLAQDENGRYVWTFKNVRAARKLEVVKLFDQGLKNKDIACAVGYSAGQVSKIKAWAVRKDILTAGGKLTQTGFEWLSRGEKQETF